MPAHRPLQLRPCPRCIRYMYSRSSRPACVATNATAQPQPCTNTAADRAASPADAPASSTQAATLPSAVSSATSTAAASITAAAASSSRAIASVWAEAEGLLP